MSHPDFALAESVTTTNATYFIAAYILVLIYCCFALAIVCDVYFVPALQKISYTYDLPPDIAGSTLMALGASVPELFASLIGVFVTEDDIGTGSIIGSSCFNLIAVPAACAFVASATFTRKLTISPMPVIRNASFYAITILVLLLIIKDNKVDILEACILLLFFVMYMALMIFSAQVKSLKDSFQNSITSSSYISTDSAIASGCNGSEKSRNNSIAGQEIVHYNQHNHNHHNQHNQYQQTGNNNLYHNQYHQRQQQQQQQSSHQPVYDQFYFAPLANQSNMNNNFNNQLISERTPLVSSSTISQQGNKFHSNYVGEYRLHANSNNNDFNNHHQKPVDLSSIVDCCNQLDNSVRLNLDIVMKNSICLSKNNHSLTDSIAGIKQQKYQQTIIDGNHNFNDDKHGEQWLSSNWILVPMLPITICMTVLTPCKFKTTCWTIWTFLVSIALIGCLTYVSVWMVHLFGQAVGIPETVAGMTILSWGTGIPELIASIVLIKKTAQADMAICNTIGSNVIDVSFCLSLPWIVKCIMNKTEHLKPEVDIQSSALPWTSFTLLISVLLLILIFKMHDWTLSFSVGVWLSATYISFVIIATFLESSFSEDGIDLMALF